MCRPPSSQVCAPLNSPCPHVAAALLLPCRRRCTCCRASPPVPSALPPPEASNHSSALISVFECPTVCLRAGEVPVLDVSYQENGDAVVRTSIGGPVAKRGPVAGAPASPKAARAPPQLGCGGGGGAGGRTLPMLLLVSCFMAALAAVAGTYPAALLGLPWLS